MKPKRAGVVVVNKIDKSDLYPDGKVYMVTLWNYTRKGMESEKKIKVSIDNLDEALDVIEEFIETGWPRAGDGL